MKDKERNAVKVIRTIRSCRTLDQLAVAKNMMNLFDETYGGGWDMFRIFYDQLRILTTMPPASE